MMQNPYADGHDKAAEYLRLALLLLAKHKLPVSPIHYRMAYDGVAGYSDVLNKALMDAATLPAEAVSARLWECYQSAYIQDDATLDKIRRELTVLIGNMHKDMERSGGTLNSYSVRLREFLELLSMPRSSQEMEVEINRVIDDTHAVAQSHRQFEAQIHQVSEELDALRNELRQVKQASLMDALTGIGNRAAFDLHLEQAVEAALQGGGRFSLLLADIDYFKKINDSYGHLIGDKVLRYVATLLKRCVKGSDFVARFGGEEFAIMLPNTDLSGAYIVAEQLREAVSSSRLKDINTGKTYSRVTISIGVAELAPGEPLASLIERTDRSLYQAKSAGRNRCEKAV